MPSRTETGIQTIAPQARSAVPVDAFVQTFPNPSAGAGLASIAQALGVVSKKVDASAKTSKDAKDKAYTDNIDYYTQSFINDHENGIVDATQVGRAVPGASPIVAGKIAEKVGANWGNTYARGKLDEFLNTGDAARLDPAAQRAFFDNLLADVSTQTAEHPFYGQGAISATKSLIGEYESNLQREAAGHQTKVQEEAFIGDIASIAKGQPVTFGPNADPKAPYEGYSFLKERLVNKGRTEDIKDMNPAFAGDISRLIQAAPPGIQEGLGILSGARSNSRQQALFDAAVKKYGSEAAARKWVAPPGKSKHNGGAAADLSYNGKSLAHAPQEVVDWVHANAASFNLEFPLGNENWHVEPLGLRAGTHKVSEASNNSAVDAIASAASGPRLDPSSTPTDLLEMIGKGESEGNYNAYSDHADNRSISFTNMTVNEVLAWQRTNIASGDTTSSAVGKYQVINKTLQGAVKSLNLTGDEVFSREFQDNLAMHLLNGRGYEDFKNGKITASEFQNNLAKEWASLPTSEGKGYYPGQGPRVDGSKLRVAMSTVGPTVNSLEALDTYAGQTSSINPIRRRELIVQGVIQQATAALDVNMLDQIPAKFLSIPGVLDAVSTARRNIPELAFAGWSHQQTRDAAAKKEKLLEGQQGILNELKDSGEINLTDYVNDPDLYTFAKSVQSDEFTQPAVSRMNMVSLQQKLVGYGTTGMPSDTPGDTDFEKMQYIIANTNGITATDRIALFTAAPQLLEGQNVLTDPGTVAHFNSYVGLPLDTYLRSIEGGVGKMLGIGIGADVREAFDTTLQSLVSEHILAGQGPISGKVKREMLKEASDAATSLMNARVGVPSGPAATSSAAAEAPTLSDEEMLKLYSTSK